MSRTSSTNTVFQVQKSPPVAPSHFHEETQSSITRRRKGQEESRSSTYASPNLVQKTLPQPTVPSTRVGDESSSSSSDSDDKALLSRSKAYTRRPRYSASKAPLGPLSDAEEESEDSPPFLPFSDAKSAQKAISSTGDPSATLRVTHRTQIPHQQSQTPPNGQRQLNPPQTVHSSSSSAQSQPVSRESQGPRVPLSSLSPRQRRLVKEGSDGTPSMGSSFSDLDDASVTQSALEEALANDMRRGSVASRMSTISQALRSRYL